MEKSNGNSNPTDNEMMNYLVRYVIGKPFPHKHNVMEVDDRYGIRMLTPWEIFESTEGAKKNTRYLITFQKREKAKKFYSKAAPGIWKPTGKAKPIFDGKKRQMGYVKISWYYYYVGRDKSSLRKSVWHMREYYLTDRYLPSNKVERKDVLFTMMIKTKEQKGKSDDMQIIQSAQGIQLDHQISHNDVASCNLGISVQKQIIQSLQGLQLQDSW